MLELRRPNLKDKETILDMMREFEAADSSHDGGFWSEQDFDYQAWLDYNLDAEIGIGLADNAVPAIQLVSFDEKGRAIGFVHLRLRLNDFLLEQGGHIGYSIRPCERGKGYGKEQLTKALQICQLKNMKQLLLTCKPDNLASRALIMGAGGQLEDIRQGLERYWIDFGGGDEQS